MEMKLPDGRVAKAKDLPRIQNPTDRMVASVEAVVDATPQKLSKRLRSFMGSCLQIPSNLAGESQIVLQSLFSCFERQKEVKEGLIGDLMWGFEQAGIPAKLTMTGLAALEREGYVRFQAPDGAFVPLSSDQIGRSWVRYQPKLLDMVYDSSPAHA